MKTLRVVIDNHRKEFQVKEGKRILIATVAADGHFNPLTGIAKFLSDEGYDVRWYTQEIYKERVLKMGIQFYPFINAPQINQQNFEEHFADRKKISGTIAKFRFDFTHAYLHPAKAYYDDIFEIHRLFPFDLMIADIMFSGTPYVKDKLRVPVIAVGVMPLMETSEDLAPAGLGMAPARTLVGKWWHKMLRKFADRVIFSPLNKRCQDNFDNEGVSGVKGNVVDILYRKADVVLQSGSPAFEYKRSDLNPNIHFAGPVYPFSSKQQYQLRLEYKMAQYKKIILVTQGTIEKDPEKILVPVLEAYKNSNFLVVATTGGAGTDQLRKRFPFENVIIEDFIPFSSIMPFADVYISNGGYGGVLMSIKNNLPMIVAGIHEGKCEICARVGYFKIGKNLRTEFPSAAQIKKAVAEVINDAAYKINVTALARDFDNYDTHSILLKHVKTLIARPLNLTPLYSIDRSDRLRYHTA